MYDPNYKGQEIIDPIPGETKNYMTEEEINHTKALYAAEITFVDKWIGYFLDCVEQLGLMENTLIVHTSDHGEPFGEHGIIRKAKPWNYTELLHIPLLIYHPEGVGRGEKINAIVQTTDLMPTILDFLGIREVLELPFLAPRSTGTFPQDIKVASKKITLHGKSLIPLMKKETEKIRDYAYYGRYGASWSIRNHEWSFHMFLDGSRGSELYKVSEDYFEQKNLIFEHKDVAEKLELELRRFVSEL